MLLVLFACNNESPTGTTQNQIEKYLTIPSTPYNYAQPELPAFYYNQFVTIQDNTPQTNPITNWGATLGRVLFYDKQLSLNKTIACASCHIQQFGFTDTSQFSTGFYGERTHRHSMALANARYYSNGRFFWDERAASLEEQVLMPIQDSVEMGMTLPKLESRLRTSPFYPILFTNAFGDTAINTQRIAKALAQFVRSMVSYQSKYDEGRALVQDRTQDFPNFSSIENAGKTIFMKHQQFACFSCHNTDAFITDNPRNNGLVFNQTDRGIIIHTGVQTDFGKFKASSLKNVAVRHRFMHNGSLRGLDELIEFYNSGIKFSTLLDPHLKQSNNAARRLSLSNSDKEALKAFLHTLTDTALLTDVKFSNPFR